MQDESLVWWKTGDPDAAMLTSVNGIEFTVQVDDGVVAGDLAKAKDALATRLQVVPSTKHFTLVTQTGLVVMERSSE